MVFKVQGGGLSKFRVQGGKTDFAKVEGGNVDFFQLGLMDGLEAQMKSGHGPKAQTKRRY